MIGIGITTRQRGKILDFALKHFNQFKPDNDYIIFVVDDNSPNPQETKEAVDANNQDGKIHLLLSQERLGIAKAKNECLKFLRDSGCEYFFLFDDDAFPRQEGWDSIYIDIANKTGVQHMMHLVEIPGWLKANTTSSPDIMSFGNCGGVMLFLTREVLDRVGGYRKEFGIYGYEHAEYSSRIYASGFAPNYSGYLCPTRSHEYIYSLDYDLNNLGIQPPLGEMPVAFTSSLEGEQAKIKGYIQENSVVYGKPTHGKVDL